MEVDSLALTFFNICIDNQFSFMQKDNVRNQRENVVLMVANAQSRLGIPAESDPVSLFYVS